MALVNDTKEKTVARIQLDIALGKKQISLRDLTETEFDDLLKKTLNEVDLRELRGFKPLKDLLTFSNYGGGIPDPQGVRNLGLSKTIDLMASGFEEDSLVDMDTHVMLVCRGGHEIVYKRYESGEETTDRSIVNSWGQSAYLYKGNGRILALRRPRNHSYGDKNLIVVLFWFEKVLLESRHIITKFNIESLPVEDFRQCFGPSYVRIASELIREIKSAYSRTTSELESQANRFRDKTASLTRLSEAIAYD